MKSVRLVVVVAAMLAVWLLPVNSDRILAIFPSPAKSHQIVFRAFVDGLLARGHQLTVMSPDPFETDNPNITQIDWSYGYKVVNEIGDVAKVTQEGWSAFRVITKLLSVAERLVEVELAHPEVQAMIQNPVEQFDAVVVEYFMMPPFHAFAELYNAPLIGITSIDSVAYAHDIVGNVANIMTHPEMIHSFSRDLCFWQRIWAFATRIVSDYYMFPMSFKKMDEIIEFNFGTNMSISYELMNRLDFLMTNVEPALGFVRPTVPQAIQLGFLHVKPPKPLPKGLQRYLDSSEHGVIYFSFGTLIRTQSLHSVIVRILLETFKTLKYDVLWKVDERIDLSNATNVKVVRWVPQQDVLVNSNSTRSTKLDKEKSECESPAKGNVACDTHICVSTV
ncbi:glucosyl/glucuronosyl transferase [Culex quinquefasciatus]|uniref:Glucosyl/glucuronosyl transferase n=1 Tax=Culex quinquefasciatus TaxID=7176 RepID=B0X985_CULQU|nr:glucosyl/glucuronosyl transferase [Culex quinquefasciatus]|eukprot:XP_001866207.1 glucosyl/glucuronosyl transferase [Culex quinquefasciatus]